MIDHFYPDQLGLFHCMDSFSPFSSVHLVPDGTVFSATLVVETTWIGKYWHPITVQEDQAFANDEFMVYLQSHRIKFRPVPSRKHYKHTLDPNHGVIRYIFICMTHALPDTSKSILTLRAVYIINNLYGSDVMSTFKLTKGFSKPLLDYHAPEMVSDELINARD